MADPVEHGMKDDSDYGAAGWAAVQAAQWLEAKQQFEAALQEADTPAARDGLGLTLWWLNDIHAAHNQRTIAYLGYKNAANIGALPCWRCGWPASRFFSAPTPAR